MRFVATSPSAPRRVPIARKTSVRIGLSRSRTRSSSACLTGRGRSRSSASSKPSVGPGVLRPMQHGIYVVRRRGHEARADRLGRTTSRRSSFRCCFEMGTARSIITTAACSRLTGMDIGPRAITVRRTSSKPGELRTRSTRSPPRYPGIRIRGKHLVGEVRVDLHTSTRRSRGPGLTSRQLTAYRSRRLGSARTPVLLDDREHCVNALVIAVWVITVDVRRPERVGRGGDQSGPRLRPCAHTSACTRRRESRRSADRRRTRGSCRASDLHRQ